LCAVASAIPTTLTQKNYPQSTYANWAIFSKGKGERGKKECGDQIAQIALGSNQLKSYFIKELFS
jgi:hypothetical protein